MRWLLFAVLAAGCGSQRGDACDLPSQPSFNCEASQSSTSCFGGPEWSGGHDAGTFGVGCVATVPECSEFSHGEARTFSCAIGPDGKPGWYEPI